MAREHKLSIDKDTRKDLIRLLRVAYPHPDFPDGPYERTADKIISQVDASTWHQLALTQGLASLDAAAEGDFSSLDEDKAAEILQEIEDAEFFRFIRGVTVVTLYNDHET